MKSIRILSVIVVFFGLISPLLARPNLTKDYLTKANIIVAPSRDNTNAIGNSYYGNPDVFKQPNVIAQASAVIYPALDTSPAIARTPIRFPNN